MIGEEEVEDGVVLNFSNLVKYLNLNKLCLNYNSGQHPCPRPISLSCVDKDNLRPFLSSAERIKLDRI